MILIKEKEFDSFLNFFTGFLVLSNGQYQQYRSAGFFGEEPGVCLFIRFWKGEMTVCSIIGRSAFFQT